MKPMHGKKGGYGMPKKMSKGGGKKKLIKSPTKGMTGKRGY